MDRFVVKEPRDGAGFPQGNQMIAFSANARSGGSMMSPENLYYNGGYPHNFQNVQQTVGMPQNLNSPHLAQTQQPQTSQTTFPNMLVPQSHNSGIDPRYLAEYADNSPQYLYIVAGQMQRNQPTKPFGADYQNRSFVGADSNKPTIVSNSPQVMTLGGLGQMQRNQPTKPFGADYQNRSFVGADRNKPKIVSNSPQVMTLGGLEPSRVEEMPVPKPYTTVTPAPKNLLSQPTIQHKFASSNKPNELDLIRNDVQQMMSRTDKLKALNKSGPRAFSGPVEKVLKWHKSLQEVGVLVIYEIVGKCVSVRPGENCAKTLVVRDDNGPAIQVVYYEIDFLLLELKPPCTVRVIGRMLAGTCRLQAFNVRPATGDDVATLPRRAAVATHHVAKLCKEYGHNGQA